ncbi:MAG: FliM/FliN family flagellar motor switch protein [Pseudomonadota bacterium]
MPSEIATSTLHRMAGVRPAPDGAGPAAGAAQASAAPALERAVRMAIQRLAEDAPTLGLATLGCTSRMVEAGTVFEGLDPATLCLLSDPPGLSREAEPDREALAAATGALALSPEVTDALIEVQTVGTVTGAAGAARRPTRIDAALAQPFARDLLAQTAKLVPAGDAATPRPGPLRPGRYAAGPGPLPTLLTAERFLRLDVSVALGTERKGSLVLILPHKPAAVLDGPAEETDPDPAWAETVRTVMSDAPVRLEAVLTGPTLPLRDLLALEVGQLLPLPDGALASVSLRGGDTKDHRRRASRRATLTGRLGQFQGMRAIKVAEIGGVRLPAGQTTLPAAADPLAMPDPLGAPGRGEARPADPTEGSTLPEGGVPARPGDIRADGPGQGIDLSDLPDLPDLADLA